LVFGTISQRLTPEGSFPINLGGYSLRGAGFHWWPCWNRVTNLAWGWVGIPVGKTNFLTFQIRAKVPWVGPILPFPWFPKIFGLALKEPVSSPKSNFLPKLLGFPWVNFFLGKGRSKNLGPLGISLVVGQDKASFFLTLKGY